MIIETDQKYIEKFAKKYFPTFKISESPFIKILTYIRENEIIGFIAYSVMYDRAEIEYFAVKEEYRGKGISRRMFRVLRKKLKECKCITLEVKCSNKRAINFYKKNGFKKVGIRKNYYKNSDGLLMINRLEVI